MRRRFKGLLLGIVTFAMMFTVLFSATGLTSAAADNDVAYIMGYFAENGNYGAARYALHLAYSYDGLNYIPLNQNNPVVTPTLGNKGLRDPYIFRKQDGNFVVLATDMTGIDMGGNKSKYLHCWDSTDGLQSFTNYRLLQVNNSSTMHAWAPNAFWDPSKNQYAICWSGDNKIHVSYTSDFKTVTDFNNLTVFHQINGAIYDGEMVSYNGKYYFYNANGAIHGFRGTSLNPKRFTDN